jgi:hypothetical protein
VAVSRRRRATTGALGLAAVLLFLAPWVPGCNRETTGCDLLLQIPGDLVGMKPGRDAPNEASRQLASARTTEERTDVVLGSVVGAVIDGSLSLVLLAGLSLLLWPRSRHAGLAHLAAIAGAGGALSLHAISITSLLDKEPGFAGPSLLTAAAILAGPLLTGLVLWRAALGRGPEPSRALAALAAGAGLFPWSIALWGLRAETLVLAAALWLEAGAIDDPICAPRRADVLRAPCSRSRKRSRTRPSATSRPSSGSTRPTLPATRSPARAT